MKKFSIKNQKLVPASHENPLDPGSLKIVLAKVGDINPMTHLQMINWAVLRKGRRFEPHYHEELDEIFIVLSGKVEIKIDREIDTLEKGEGVIVPMKSIHTMRNLSETDVEYLAIGFSLGKNGRTVNVNEIA